MNFFSRLLINRALKKIITSTIPRSGDKAKDVDCYQIYFRAKDKSWAIFCKELSSEGVTGKYWLNNEELGDKLIPWSELSNYNFVIEHFYGFYNLRYSSVSEYFFHNVLPLDKLKIFLGKANQFLFNRSELVRSERIDTLKLILEQTIINKDYFIAPTSLTSLLYSYKWVYHPDRTEQLAYNGLLLESLCESGELTTVKGGYKLTPKALITISNHNEEQTRHSDNLSQLNSTKFLTLALVFVGLIQACITLYGICSA